MLFFMEKRSLKIINAKEKKKQLNIRDTQQIIRLSARKSEQMKSF